MLFYFNISIKTSNLKKAKIQERLIEWGGELFSQEPPQYEYNGTLLFDEFPDNNYFKKYFGRFISNDLDIDNYRTFRLLGKHLSELERLINTNSFDLENHELYKFLADLSEIDDFAIFLIRDEEEIDDRYRIKTKDELVEILCNCLKWDLPKGALITKLS